MKFNGQIKHTEHHPNRSNCLHSEQIHAKNAEHNNAIDYLEHTQIHTRFAECQEHDLYGNNIPNIRTKIQGVYQQLVPQMNDVTKVKN